MRIRPWLLHTKKKNVLEESKEKYIDGAMVVLLCSSPFLSVIFKTLFQNQQKESQS